MLFSLSLVGHGQPWTPSDDCKKIGEISVGWVVVVVGSAVTSERDSGKELWSNADGFPHFSGEDAEVEFSELPSSPNELNDSCLFLPPQQSLLARLLIPIFLCP